MVDNVDITPGTGATVAADLIGGALYQRVKPTIGADGTAVDVSAGAGAVGTGVQRMTLASDDPGVVSLAAILAKLIAAPATEATSAAILAKLIAAPSTEATLAAILAKIIAAPATEATIAAILAALKAEDAASANADLLFPMGVIQKASPADLAGTDGDYAALQMSGGRLWTSAKEVRSATGTQSIVASSATDVTILASNAARLGGTIYNDSTQILYLLLANATSSATVYSVAMAAAAYFEIPAGYTGVVKGIWASANGNARVTELT